MSIIQKTLKKCKLLETTFVFNLYIKTFMPNPIKSFWHIQEFGAYFQRWKVIEKFVNLVHYRQKLIYTWISFLNPYWLEQNKPFSSTNLTLPAPFISESCIKIKINLNFHFYTSLWCLKRFYEGLWGLHNTFWGTTKKGENKN